ncbi:NAD(P)H-hydrate dehydratase [Verrucomicrobia bacterium LW23]|nr:NAD(P)H-hydrate dehydratase [Verrucomicrobia bacterium LW23]
MTILSVAEMLAYEKRIIASGAPGTSADELMELAGKRMAIAFAAAYPPDYPNPRNMLILCGKGNNAGDGLVMARYLSAIPGYAIRIRWLFPTDALAELPRVKLSTLRASAPCVDIAEREGVAESDWPDSDGVVVDALLGLGSSGAPRDNLAELLEELEDQRQTRNFNTVALDIPTGLLAVADALESDGTQDEEDLPPAFVASLTLTVGWPKDVLVREAVGHWVGRLEVIPIFDSEDLQPTPADAASLARHESLLTAADAALAFPRRSAASYKGNFGRVLIVGGSPGMAGAPILSALAALSGGAGLVNLAVHPVVLPSVAALAPPEAMVSAWPVEGDEENGPDGEEWQRICSSASVIAIGPGLGAGEAAEAILELVILSTSQPLVLDASALTVLATRPDLMADLHGRAVLTPHLGEMRRLLGVSQLSLRERAQHSRAFARNHGIVLVLKGMRTIVSTPVWYAEEDESDDNIVPSGPADAVETSWNSSGNPALAAGGSGDTLTGLIAAIIAQGNDLGDAARAAVWLHGHAADLEAAVHGCEVGVRASDVSRRIPQAIASARKLASMRWT